MLTLHSQHLFFPLAGSPGGDLGIVEGAGAGDVPGVGEDCVGDDGVDDKCVAGGPLGGGVEGSDDSSERAKEMSLSPSYCGMSAIAVMSHVGSLGGWRCCLRFAGGAGGDRLVVVTAPLPAAFFFAVARVLRAAAATTLAVVAATTLAVVAAAALWAAAVVATVAAEAATAA
jgi:hypothetical protein